MAKTSWQGRSQKLIGVSFGGFVRSGRIYVRYISELRAVPGRGDRWGWRSTEPSGSFRRTVRPAPPSARHAAERPENEREDAAMMGALGAAAA